MDDTDREELSEAGTTERKPAVGPKTPAMMSLQELTSAGKELGLEGQELYEFIREQQALDREERRVVREERQKELDLAETKLRLEHEARMEELRMSAPTSPSHSIVDEYANARMNMTAQSAKLKVPKFENKQISSVAKYLEVFESIVKQNGLPEEAWPLTLRASVTGTKLEELVDLGGGYGSIKKEILSAFGKTPETLWNDLTSLKQGGESFRQFCLRAERMIDQFEELAVNENSDFKTTMLKFSLLNHGSSELRTFLLERRVAGMTFSDFIDAGMAYQEAHGRPKSDRKDASLDMTPEQPTLQTWKISVGNTLEDLSKEPELERKHIALAKHLCFNCLRPGHPVRACRSLHTCQICKKKHHTLLHASFSSPEAESQTKSQSGEKIGSYGVRTNAQDTVHLMTAVAEVKGQKRAQVRVFLDMGSQASFVSDALVEAIRPERLEEKHMTINAFGGKTEARMTKFSLGLTTTSGKVIKFEAWKQPTIGVQLAPAAPSVCAKWEREGIELSDQPHKYNAPHEVHCLLGADVLNTLLLEKKEVDGCVAWRTEIGWVLSGRQGITEEKATQDDVTVAFVSTQMNRTWDERISNLWETEEPMLMDRQAYGSGPVLPIDRVGERYEVGLLWKGDKRPPDNRYQAVACAKQLAAKLEKTGEREAYEAVLLKEYEQLDAIEREPNPDVPGYYLPHHAVMRTEAATTKTRVVFNASASTKGNPSLNDLVDPGPSLLPDLVGLLIRVREYKAAVQADIRKAFFMIAIRNEDRPFLRFVWPGADGSWITWRLKKLPFGVNCAPFVLNAVLQKHLMEEAAAATGAQVQAILELLRKSLYVDDCVTSVETADQAVEFRKVSTSHLTTAGMELRKWRSNVMPPEEGVGRKVLGIIWNTESDDLSLDVVNVIKSGETTRWTRRLLLKAVASLYDPLGLAAPVQLTGKILLQQAWHETNGWDEYLSDELSMAVEKWWGEMTLIPQLKIRRWIGASSSETQVTLHVFADASEKGFGCCIYSVIGETTVLLYSKTKVAPLKAETLPRLELQAASMAAGKVAFLMRTLRVKVEAVHGWTDSLTTLQWIQGQAFRWKTWVRNRVARIQEISRDTGMTWRHVPGVHNPSDIASRGASVDDLHRQQWFVGPSWLPHQELWPKEAIPEQPVQVQAVQVATHMEPWWIRLSRWTRIVGVVRRMLEWRHRAAKKLPTTEEAERVLFRLVQAESFGADLEAIKEGSALPQQSKLAKFQPFLDKQGLLRVGGRLVNSGLTECSMHPVLLGKHYLTRLLLEEQHRTSLHQGVEAVLANSRDHYWIFGARRILRSIKSLCVTCRRYGAGCADEVTAPLPVDRVTYGAPFSVCGVDYAGPLIVKECRRNSSLIKNWIALFVCAITRAVHLELAASLSVEDFLLAWRRFVARRGRPKRVRSDNGTTFVAAAKILQHVEWIFNPPSAPWFGGFYERLVGVVKAPLKKVLGRALLGHEELATLLCEVERVVNNRPLTHVGDITDELPLTPAKLLGEMVWSDHDAEVLVESCKPEQLKRRARYLQQLSKQLRQRWTRQYLVGLQGYHAGQSSPLAVGDVVLIVDDNKKRSNWKLAVVQRLFAGKDGKRRVAEVKCANGAMLRPIRRLVPLEVRRSEISHPADQNEEVPPSQPGPQSVPAGCVRTRTRLINPPDRLDL